MNETLIVFTRAPVAGECKKRLAQSLGDETALAAHIELTTGLLQRVQAFRGLRRLCVTEVNSGVTQWCETYGFSASVQIGADLGARMVNAFDHEFKDGAQRVVLVGTDCPMIDLDYVNAAFRALESNDLVIGPAEDGGYGLIGMTATHPALFQNVRWGRADVRSTTLKRAAAAGLTTAVLREIWDVDTAEDWDRYLRASRPCGK